MVEKQKKRISAVSVTLMIGCIVALFIFPIFASVPFIAMELNDDGTDALNSESDGVSTEGTTANITGEGNNSTTKLEETSLSMTSSENSPQEKSSTMNYQTILTTLLSNNIISTDIDLDATHGNKLTDSQLVTSSTLRPSINSEITKFLTTERKIEGSSTSSSFTRELLSQRTSDDEISTRSNMETSGSSSVSGNIVSLSTTEENVVDQSTNINNSPLTTIGLNEETTLLTTSRKETSTISLLSSLKNSGMSPTTNTRNLVSTTIPSITRIPDEDKTTESNTISKSFTITTTGKMSTVITSIPNTITQITTSSISTKSTTAIAVGTTLSTVYTTTTTLTTITTTTTITTVTITSS
ncbi:hypothetical protein SNEBB_000582 [Seison nebaliae]|nr:hypothetical protein SNEBB_000582 [Seison nebaliae]